MYGKLNAAWKRIFDQLLHRSVKEGLWVSSGFCARRRRGSRCPPPVGWLATGAVRTAHVPSTRVRLALRSYVTPDSAARDGYNDDYTSCAALPGMW